MRLLLLDQFSDLGGAQHGLLEVAAAVRERGWSALAGLPGEGELFARLRRMGVPAEPIECGPYASGRKRAGDVARFVASTPRLARQIRALADSWSAEVVYINGPRLLPAVLLAGLRLPVVFHTHSLVTSRISLPPAAMALRRLDAWLLASCEFTARPWRRCVRGERTAVVFNGVEGPPAGWRRKTEAAPRIGCIGRIAPEKGQMEFLAAARAIHRAIPECRFAIYGAAVFGDAAALRYESAVRRAAEALPVEVSGWVPNVYDALAQLDVMLVPSAPHEATTRVILEAFAAGVPVIAFRSGGIAEVIEDGVEGCLADSVEAMAHRAVHLCRAPEERGRLACGGRAAWERRFTLQRYGSAVTDFLLEATFHHQRTPETRTPGSAIAWWRSRESR